ncbi:ethanolamine utilization protein EutH [Alkalibacter mobilis]|uniref:ethanolamine utilization protein EutH n=1 Tax=Alkalibacter mobilis TaxID=2787712 RepID=UPI00189DB6FE|nr:ethanolamine utilization protein EutH [Alkalibacter mobilis]MBF7096744.1 ethanolamine utilization protein EutH [Alkalibacter mobilis]
MIEQIIFGIMGIGVLIGGADKVFGNRLGLGEKFDEGFNAMGPLALNMVGIVCLAPVISKCLQPIVAPLFSVLGIDPAMAGVILANDMGGYAISMELAQNEQAGLLAGVIVSSMLGCTLVFTMPIGFGLVKVEDRRYFANGLLIGLISIPFGGLLGGMVAGFDSMTVIINMLPVLVLSMLIALGLKFAPSKIIKYCIVSGQIITKIIYIGLASAAFQSITGIVIIRGMAPIMEGMNIVAKIGIVLLGTFPVLSILVKALDRPLNFVGKKIGLDTTSIAGVIFSLANSVPVFGMLKDMNIRGKITSTAWMVPASAALGDHLGFTASVRPDMIVPMMTSKLAAGALAVVLALFITKDLKE